MWHTNKKVTTSVESRDASEMYCATVCFSDMFASTVSSCCINGSWVQGSKLPTSVIGGDDRHMVAKIACAHCKKQDPLYKRPMQSPQCKMCLFN